MNRQNFNIPGGFPLETDTLDEIQKAYSLFNALGCLAGDKAIIQGCEDDGKAVKDGVVYVNGELLEFRGGPRQDTVVVKEDKTSKAFEDGEEHVVLCKRYLGFGTGDAALDWRAFKRFRSLVDLQQALTPVGTVVMWSGALDAIPIGWLLCDGTKGTPDLRDRFIVGAGKTYKVADQGGADQLTLTTDQLPAHSHTANTAEAGSHSHSASTSSDGDHSHIYRDSFHLDWETPSASGESFDYERRSSINYYGIDQQIGRSSGFIWYINRNTNSTGNHLHTITVNSAGKHTHSVTLDNTGSGQAHENRPPYYALAYIIYKG